MSYSISQLKTDITGILHGTNLNKIQGVDQLINRAAREVLLDVDPTETIRISPLGLMFDDVFQVAAPSDLKGNKVIDIRPQSQQRYLSQNVRQQYMKDFDLYKDRSFGIVNFNVQHNSGIKTLQIDNPTLPGSLVVNDLGAITSNGTWTTVLGASNLAVDTIVFAQGASSLRFDTSGTNSGIEINMGSPVDLSNRVGISSFFQFVYIPNASIVTSITLKWGSSSSDYWTATVNTDVSGNAIADYWNQFMFEWDANTTQSGTPNAASITYLQAVVNTTGGVSDGVRMGRINNAQGLPQEIVYYSKFLFSNNGIFSESVTNDNTVVNLDTDSYNLLTYKCAQLCFQQQHDFADRGGLESDKWALRYAEVLQTYKALYKTETVKQQSFYYKADLGNRRGFGSNRIN